MSKYDDIVKRLGRLRPKDFVQWLCPNIGILDISFEDREFELTYRRTDLLYKVNSEVGGEFYLHLEFQAELKKGFSIRLHEYSTRIRREFGLPVKSVVVFLDSTPAIEKLSPIDRVEFMGEVISEFKYTKLILPDEIWQDIINYGLPALFPLVPLTRIAQGEEKEALHKASVCIEEIAEKELRGELAAVFYLIGGYRYREQISRVIGDKLMQDLMESVTYREAVEAGQKKERKESIITVLKAKFHIAPEEIQDRFDSITMEDLNKLLEKAATAKKFREFEEMLTEIEKRR